MEYLFDDLLIARKGGVRRVVGRPAKQAEPILVPEEPWEERGISSRHSLMYDEEARLFRMWYQSVAPGEGDDVVRYACYAESDDGVRWRRPQLGLIPYRGSKENNIFREASDADGFLWNVVKDPDDPDPARRYKAVGFDYCAESGIPGVKPGTMGICVGYSPDGLRWTDPKLVLHTEDLTDADCILPVRDPATRLWTGFFRRERTRSAVSSATRQVRTSTRGPSPGCC